MIAERKKHYTRALERYVRDLCLMMTIRDVSRHTGLHWATVKAIDRRRLRKNLPSVSCLRRLRYLGIDEVSLKKRHRYLTPVVDLQTGRIVYVGVKRGERSLSPFFKKLRRLWRFESREEAERFFFDWIRKALNSGIGKLVKFATRLLHHAEGILNYFRYPISTAMVEGINNKIKVIKRKAYGYRDVEYFKLKIYNLHLSRYSLL